MDGGVEGARDLGGRPGQDGHDLAHRHDLGPNMATGDGIDHVGELAGTDAAEIEEATVDDGGARAVALELYLPADEDALVVGARMDDDDVAVGSGIEGVLDRRVLLAPADMTLLSAP